MIKAERGLEDLVDLRVAVQAKYANTDMGMGCGRWHDLEQLMTHSAKLVDLEGMKKKIPSNVIPLVSNRAPAIAVNVALREIGGE